MVLEFSEKVFDLKWKTHRDVLDRMFDRASAPPGVMFFTADTGLGKTTGFQRGIQKLWGLPQFAEYRFLVLVPTKRDADQMYRDLTELVGATKVWPNRLPTSIAATSDFDG